MIEIKAAIIFYISFYSEKQDHKKSVSVTHLLVSVCLLPVVCLIYQQSSFLLDILQDFPNPVANTGVVVRKPLICVLVKKHMMWGSIG